MQKGIVENQIMTVEELHTANSLGSGDLEVFGTPALIAFVENTSKKLVSSYLQKGETTVGTYLEIEHFDSTPVGMSVSSRVELIEIDRKKLTFTFTVSDEKGEISKGRHHRFIVNRDKFMDKTMHKLLEGINDN